MRVEGAGRSSESSQSEMICSLCLVDHFISLWVLSELPPSPSTCMPTLHAYPCQHRPLCGHGTLITMTSDALTFERLRVMSPDFTQCQGLHVERSHMELIGVA